MIKKHNFLLGIILITTVYFLFTLLTYKNYGITSDERVEYTSGKALLEYYTTGNTPKDLDIESRHLPENSTYFRAPLALFNLLNPENYYEKFHFLNMLFALPIFIISYILLYIEYRKLSIALSGPIALVLTPRLFGDIPANPKDVPFAIIFFLSVVAIYLFRKYNTSALVRIIVLGILFGIAQTYRLIGLSLYIIYFLSFVKNTNNLKVRTLLKFIVEGFFIFLIAGTITIISMPIFNNGIKEGVKTLVSSTINFSYWNNKILYMGEFITKEQRPASYLPVWITITTPLLYLVPFLFSPLIFMYRKQKRDLYDILIISFLVNIFLYFVMHPVIYNGLRHFLFLIPIITFVSLLTIIELFKLLSSNNKYFKCLLIIFVLLGSVDIVSNYITLHPYEYVYFNELIGGLKGASGKYDTDYWGASYKEATEWLLSNANKNNSIKVYPCDMAYAVLYYSQFKLSVVKTYPNYIICDKDMDLSKNYTYPIVHTIDRQGVPLNVIRIVE